MNCPNCAAPITGPKCEYCGTVHEDVMAKAYEIRVQLNRSLAESSIEKLYAEAISAFRTYATVNEIRKGYWLKEI